MIARPIPTQSRRPPILRKRSVANFARSELVTKHPTARKSVDASVLHGYALTLEIYISMHIR